MSGRKRSSAEESREALRQVERDTQTIVGSPLTRAKSHFAGADAHGTGIDGGTDPIELWGRRIGRALSVGLALALCWWLGSQLGWL